ncbi:cation diffusion facilitator family transporter [Vibrio palustris]|uniref:Cation efflux family protein n=1 Tax=Vibrio palustris TaxID=1918946 RepID=A0A1R4B6R5_9VIBR|nr:cation transporter [Vibrio palustris]SJL84561.1 Cation efflux family protein [Vibrio palustris]
MSSTTQSNEKRALIFSAFMAMAFACSSLLIGLIVNSLVIAFDGLYSSISLLLTLVSLAVSKLIEKPSDQTFQFGRAMLEPISIALKGFSILVLVIYSLYSSVVDLAQGGHVMDTSIAMLFGLFSVFGCSVTWWKLVCMSKTAPSALIQAEIQQWKMDTWLSVIVALAFIMAWGLSMTPFAAVAVYMDPMMMLIMGVYFVKVPVTMIKTAMREILMMAPDKEICSSVQHGITATYKETGQALCLAGVTKVGRELWVDINIVAQKNDHIAMQEIEMTRHALQHRLSQLPLKLQLTLNVAC